MAATRLAAATPRSSGLTGGRSGFEDQSFPRFASSVPVCRLSRPVIFSSLVVCARRGKKTGPVAQNQARGKAKTTGLLTFEADEEKFSNFLHVFLRQKSTPVDEADEEGMDEDAFEKLFSLLEEDLKNDGLSGDDFDDEISEEELEKLERELAAALAEDDYEDDDEDADEDEDNDEESAPSKAQSADDDFSDDDSEEEDDITLPKLKNWQLRRLASALKIGRRKTNIKALSAELGLERAVVLEFLREPPPNLLLMAATLPDKKAAEEPSPEPVEREVTMEVASSPAESLARAEAVHVMKAQWSASKRMKKVQLETLERVYTRTRRPTNAIISSIVHTTNLPRKKVVQWFEERRVEDGESESRRPFRRSDQGSVFS